MIALRTLFFILASLSFTFGISQTSKDIIIPLAKVIDASTLPDGFDVSIINLKQQPHPASGSEVLKQQLNAERIIKQKNIPLNKTNTVNSATAPLILAGFQGNTSSSVPNDNHVAVSNGGKIVSVLNSNIRMFNEAGAVLYTKSLSGFSAALGTFSYISDPRILYDPDNDRFIALYFSGSLATNSTIIVGFSKTNDPGAVWNFYKLPGNSFNDNSWSDYPIVSLSKGELIFTFNLLQDGVVDWRKAFKQSIIWQVDKQKGYDGDSLVTKVWGDIKYNGKPLWNICPAQGGSSLQGPGMYFVSVRPSDLHNDSVFLTTLTNTIKSGSAQLSTKVFIQNKQYGLPPNAPMANGNYLQTNDARVLSATIENNMLHYVQNSIDTIYNTGAVYYGRIVNPQNNNPALNAMLIRNDTMDYGYPSIAYVGGGLNDHSVMITCSHVSKNIRPGTSVFFVDRNGTLSSQLRCKDGEGWVNVLADTNERWGDYTGIQRKYNEPGAAWISGSYGDPANYSFRTWVAKVKSTDNTLGLSGTSKNNTALLYPNPSLNTVHVEFELDKKVLINADVYDLTGKLVAHVYEDACKPGLNSFSFNAQILGAGAYVLHITADQRILVSKQFLVQ